MKLGVVGDLSGRDPARLETALRAALAACDVVVQVGDLDPAYSVCKGLVEANRDRLWLVPGNHDTGYDTIGFPRQWKTVIGKLATLVGIDNSADRLDDQARALLGDRGPTQYGFVFAHKSPKPIVLPNGQVSQHVMGEGQPNADADSLVEFLKLRADAMVCGHYHDWSVMDGPWGTPLILEGRGGAADQLGFTAITVMEEGVAYQKVDL